jgi:hypothetical protein
MGKIFGILALLLIFGCKKAEDRACYKSRGETATRIVPLEDFMKLKLKKKIKYTLVQNDSSYLKITGGKNLINFINYSYSEDGFLEVFNENKCNFLRNQKDLVEVEIHFKNLDEIFYEGSELLECKDTLNLSALYFVVLDACGTFNLKINADYLSGNISHGNGDYIVSGRAINAGMTIKSNGFCNIENFKVSNDLNLINESEGDMYCTVSGSKVKGYIAGGGNIFYSGVPISSEIKLFGTGKFLEK